MKSSPNLSVSATTSTRFYTTGTLSPHARYSLSPRRGIYSPSPPPSPSLPSLLPRHGKRKRSRGPPTIGISPSCRRLAILVAILLVGTYLVSRILFPGSPRNRINAGAQDSPAYELVNSDTLPKDPAAIIAPDAAGKQKWTVWIPPGSLFPLRPKQYREICSQVEEIRKASGTGKARTKGDEDEYYHMDKDFVDVEEAERAGMLPGSGGQDRDAQNGQGGSGHENIDLPVCKKSVTFLMETKDAGMGNSLLAVWLAYGLAKKEGREFFVDDTGWPYGNYTTYFRPPPTPSCRRPPPHHRLPCPHQSSHLIISAATFRFSFGPSFSAFYTDGHLSPPDAHRRVFDLMRHGYENLFHLADRGDETYVQERVSGKLFEESHSEGGIVIGMQIRRGDRHPWEAEYRADYLPLMRYMDEVREVLIERYEHEESDGSNVGVHRKKRRRFVPRTLNLFKLSNLKPKSKLKRHGPAGMMASKVLVASDDPLIYSAPEVARAIRAQDRIILASKTDLEAAAGNKKAGWIDEISGWEGGFWREVFFGLGRSIKVPGEGAGGERGGSGGPMGALAGKFRFNNNPPGSSSSPTGQPGLPHHSSYHGAGDGDGDLGNSFDGVSSPDISNPSDSSSYSPQSPDLTADWSQLYPDTPTTPEAMHLRALVGRAYLLDLAVLGHADAVVCAVSGAACRVLGVMMGWEKIKNGAWRNVDGAGVRPVGVQTMGSREGWVWGGRG